MDHRRRAEADEELIEAVRRLDRAAVAMVGERDPAAARHLELAHHHANEARRQIAGREPAAAA